MPQGYSWKKWLGTLVEASGTYLCADSLVFELHAWGRTFGQFFAATAQLLGYFGQVEDRDRVHPVLANEPNQILDVVLPTSHDTRKIQLLGQSTRGCMHIFVLFSFLCMGGGEMIKKSAGGAGFILYLTQSEPVHVSWCSVRVRGQFFGGSSYHRF